MNLANNLKFLNKDMTIGVLFLNKDEKFEPTLFLGEKFTKVREDTYADHEGVMVLENPNAKQASYSKVMIDQAKKIITDLGYEGIKLWFPSSESPLAITYNSEKTLIIVAPKLKNY